MTALLIVFGGGLGAAARSAVVTAIPGSDLDFPWAITIVNVFGSFALGTVVGLAGSGWTWFATEPFTVGVLGGFTTFSTWMVDIDEAPSKRMGLPTTVVPLFAGLLAATIGTVVG